ncbi:MAG: hypothetical protein JXQ73_30970 [Phycisphaerae bacterium]|nr:hypothetical protein [Phycisphaerae bacterium]
MKKWKAGLFGLVSAAVGYTFACGCCLPGLPCDWSCSDISLTSMGDIIQDILFGVLFD